MTSLIEDIRHWIDDQRFSDEVWELLLPGSKPHDFECEVFDYKLDVPDRGSGSRDHIAEFDIAVSELIKDAVSFHNAFGGYIVFGVADKGSNRLRGSEKELNVSEFNKKIEAATGKSIECFISHRDYETDNKTIRLSLLLVPRRPDDQEPVSFKKLAPQDRLGRRAYQASDVYVRRRDECRPATATSEDWRFLHSSRGLHADSRNGLATRCNARLPARDPDIIKFVGREGYFSRLREWLNDKRDPVRLLSGIGGLGKTAIAYRFAEELAETGAGKFEYIVWLTAKEKTFSVTRGSLVQASHVDFWDAESLYSEILLALGSHVRWDDEEPLDRQAIDALLEALSLYCSLIIIDDLDSLPLDVQRQVVFNLTGVAQRTVSQSDNPSRILFTSRLDQGLPPAAVIPVKGFGLEEFKEFTLTFSEGMDISPPSHDAVATLYGASAGSPLFCGSILRLVRLGSRLADALEQWAEQDGTEVRRFAFERELKRLQPSAAKVLYAASLLGETSILELSSLLETTARSIQDCVNSLRSYHLISNGTTESGSVVLTAPQEVTLVGDVLRSHLGPFARDIESLCVRARVSTHASRSTIAIGIAEVVGFWEEQRP